MQGQVLVAYATKYGATAEIAEKIGEVLVQAGLEAVVSPVNLIKDLSSYRAVVQGSAVYIGRWHRQLLIPPDRCCSPSRSARPSSRSCLPSRWYLS